MSDQDYVEVTHLRQLLRVAQDQARKLEEYVKLFEHTTGVTRGHVFADSCIEDDDYMPP